MKIIYKGTLISMFPLILGSIATAETAATKVVNESTAAEKHRIDTGWRASEVIGTAVKNADDETIGEVEDLVVDMKSGEILAVVVSSGGFLGVADTLSTVPSSVLRYDHKAKGFKTKLTKDQLSKAPQFKKSDWPDFADAATWSGVRDYRDSIGGDTTQPDNTAQNEKDMDEDSVTPMDQGNSESDLQTTKKIRAAVVDADLSFNAKNIKIVTSDGKVTLRGVVEKESEKESILSIAKQHADSANITDDLEVKNK